MARVQTRKIEFAPGFVADDTPLAAEGGYVDGDLIRFRRGRAEVIGGWEKLTTTTFDGKARGGKTWANLDGDARFAFGTTERLYGYWIKSGTTLSLNDITPATDITRLDADPITPDAIGSAVVTVSHDAHGFSDGDEVYISGSSETSVNGYRVISSVTTDSYKITADSTFDSTDATGGNPLVEYRVQKDDDRIWWVDNFGESLIALPSGGALFIGNLETYSGGEPPEILSNGSFTGNITGWAVSNEDSWEYASNEARITPDSSGQDLSGNLSQSLASDVTAGRVVPGRVYLLTFDYGAYKTGTGATATLSVSINDTSDSLISIVDEITMNIGAGGTWTADQMFSYTVAFVMPADPADIVFSGEAHGDSSSRASLHLDNVSLKELRVSHVTQAPDKANAMFVDPNRIVVLLGTVEADGDYNPMLVRWSDQENVRAWVPDTDNLAGEQPLANGGRIIGGLVTRQQNLIFTDASLYSMTFTGSSGNVFSFNLLGTGCGLIAPHAATEYNGIAFWMANDENFYIFQGGVPQTIDCPVRDYVFDDLNEDNKGKIYAGINSAFNEVTWFYPRGDATDCSHYVTFNWVEKHWTFGEMARTTWLSSGVFPYPIGFSTSGYIYKQETGTEADGSDIPWSLTTSYFDIADGGNILSVTRYVPDFERQVGNINLSFTYRYRPNGDEINFGPYTIKPGTLDIAVRHSGRQMQMKWEGATGSKFARFGVQTLDMIATGARR